MYTCIYMLLFCLLGVFRPTPKIIFILELMAFEQGSLPFHIFCDTWNPLIMVIFKDLWHSHLMPSVWQWSYQTTKVYSGLSLLGFKHLPSACGANALTDCTTTAHAFWWNICILICDLDVYFYSVCGMKSSRPFFLINQEKGNI